MNFIAEVMDNEAIKERNSKLTTVMNYGTNTLVTLLIMKTKNTATDLEDTDD